MLDMNLNEPKDGVLCSELLLSHGYLIPKNAII